HRSQPGWHIVRRIPIMGPEEHGGHCELIFDGLEIPDENVLMGLGDGLRLIQIRLGPARLTHCMRWLGLAKRCMEIAQSYVSEREGFGIKLAERESVQIKLGEMAQRIQIGPLLVRHAAWKLDQGDRARKEVSMAKVQVADTLHQAADVAIQLNGARGYSKDTILEWIYRAARAARLVDGASEVHNMVLARFVREEGRDFDQLAAGRLHPELDIGRLQQIFQQHESFAHGLADRQDAVIVHDERTIAGERGIDARAFGEVLGDALIRVIADAVVEPDRRL